MQLLPKTHITALISWILMGSVLFGCREPYDPEIEKYENILVVDGLITNSEGPNEVILARSYSYEESYGSPEEGAVVVIRDEELNEYLFTEEQPGHYLSGPGLVGIPGRSYQLFIATSDGEAYESDWVEMRPVPPIDDIQYTFMELPSENNVQGKYGAQITVSTHDPENETRYYRYEWLETWEFLTPIVSSFYLNEQRCWRSSRSDRISIATTEHLKQDVLSKHPLFTVTTDNNRLKIRYSAMIYQYAMSRDSYSYWKDLQEITQNTGSLFDPIPARVEGNIYHLPDAKLPVLGIFQASAVTSARVFISREELPSSIYVPGGFESCNFYTSSDTAEWDQYEAWKFEFVDEYVDGGTPFRIYTESPVCFRCTFSGTNQRPDYWPWPEN